MQYIYYYHTHTRDSKHRIKILYIYNILHFPYDYTLSGKFKHRLSKVYNFLTNETGPFLCILRRDNQFNRFSEFLSPCFEF